MNRLTVAAGTMLMLAWTTAARAQAAPDCGLKPLASLGMRSDVNGTITVPVKINDTEFSFLVDTGGFFSTIAPEIARTMKMSTRKVAWTQVGLSDAQSDMMASPDDFWVGPSIHSTHYWFYLRPQKASNQSGTLAPDFLRGFDVDLDFAGRKFNLIDPDHCPGKVVYWNPAALVVVPIDTTNKDQHIEIPVTVDGKSITASVDSGSSISIISMKTARNILGIGEKDPALSSAQRSINGKSIKVYSYPFQSIQFANTGADASITVNNPAILILEDREMRYFPAQLTLGISTLRQLHVYIAYKEHKMYLSPAVTRATPPAPGP